MLARLGAARLPGSYYGYLPDSLLRRGCPAGKPGCTARRRAASLRTPTSSTNPEQHDDVAAPGRVRLAARGLRLLATSERGTAQLAGLLAADISAGDCYCLLGQVGAGKSAFSRAFIRSVMQDGGFPVPSPTYLLQNTYDEHTGPPVHHFDLYRLGGEADLGRLSLDQSLSQAVSLVEWAERLQGLTPAGRMDVRITAISQDEAEKYAMYAPTSSAEDADEDTEDELRWENGGEEEEDDEEDGAEYMQFVDRKWRLLELGAHGVRMASKLTAVRAHLEAPMEAGGARFAGAVLPDLPGDGEGA